MNEREKIIVLKQILFFNFELTDDPSIGNFRLTPEQGLQIVQLYYENLRSLKNVFRVIRLTYGQHNRPNKRTIRNTITHLETQHSLLDNIELTTFSTQ